MTIQERTGGAAVTLAEIAAALRETDRVVLATHENPDGDAIGSVRSMQLILDELGHDVLVHVPGTVVPSEYAFVGPDNLISELPVDLGERTLVCLDCGNASRLARPELLEGAGRVLNVDHHADNTHYGDLNVVVGGAACTTQLVRELARELGVTPSPAAATAIYVGLVTDTGRFQYSNTTADALRLAAELVDLGVDVHEVFREVFERVEYQRVKLLARGLEHAQRFDDGRVIVTYLTRKDFDDTASDDDDAEGVVDVLRGVEHAYVALFVRELKMGSGKSRKGSLRTTREDVDVSVIARTWSGGGHRQAAGFSTDDDMETIIERVREGLSAQLATRG